jgi:hypothetical protein
MPVPYSSNYDEWSWQAFAQEYEETHAAELSDAASEALEREQTLRARAFAAAVDAAVKAEPGWAAEVERIAARGQYTQDDKRKVARFDRLVRTYERLLLSEWRKNGHE